MENLLTSHCVGFKFVVLSIPEQYIIPVVVLKRHTVATNLNLHSSVILKQTLKDQNVLSELSCFLQSVASIILRTISVHFSTDSSDSPHKNVYLHRKVDQN